jgi:hypothetical protein
VHERLAELAERVRRLAAPAVPEGAAAMNVLVAYASKRGSMREIAARQGRTPARCAKSLRGKGGRRREAGLDAWASPASVSNGSTAEIIETAHARRAPMIPVSTSLQL